MKYPVCGSLHGTILQSMCFPVHHVLHLSVAVTLVEGSKYFGFSFVVADTCPKTYIFVVEVEPGFVALQSVAVQHHTAGSVKAVADTSGKAVSIIAAFTPIGDGQGGIVLLGGDTGILAVIEYLEEISVVFSSGDEKIVYSIGGIIVEFAVTIAGFVAYGAGRGHARAGHVIVAAMHHVVEAPEHAVSRQAVVSTDVLQCLLHAVAGIGTA